MRFSWLNSLLDPKIVNQDDMQHLQIEICQRQDTAFTTRITFFNVTSKEMEELGMEFIRLAAKMKN